MQHQVTIVHRGPSDDIYGGDTLTEISRITVPGWMQMNAVIETTIGESTVVEWLLILNPSYRDAGADVTIDPPERQDQVEWDGRQFEVEGGASILRTPRGLDHYEVALKEIL
jgi:hypothetical protein